jgi:hypothetical protein
MRGKSTFDKIMRLGLHGLFMLFPISCMGVAFYDIWQKGIYSPIAVVAAGIVAALLAIRLGALSFQYIDMALDVIEPAISKVRAAGSSVRKHIAHIHLPGHGGTLTRA